MSYKNAGQPIARFVANWARTDISYGATHAVVDASIINDKISVSDVLNAPGKLRVFSLSYYPIQCDAEGDCSDDICNTGESIEPKQQLFSPTKCIASKVYQLNADDIRLIDDGGMSFSEHAQSQFATTMVSMRKALDLDILAVLIANIGLLPDGNPTVRVQLTTAQGAVNPMGLWAIDEIFSTGYFNNPFIIGGSQINFYQRAAATAGLNQFGQELGQMGNYNLYYDPLLNQAFGDGKQHLLAFDPYVLKFISWNYNAGIFATDMNSLSEVTTMFRRGLNASIHGTLADPVYPILWDIDIHFDDCKEIWTYRIRLFWDIFFLPGQVCNLQGVNGIFKFDLCDPVIPDCPTGTAYPTPPAAKTYAWTPTITYPLTVASMRVGTVSTAPNTNVANLDELIGVMNDSSAGIVFVKNGAAINYQGNTLVPGNINGTINFAFA